MSVLTRARPKHYYGSAKLRRRKQKLSSSKRKLYQKAVRTCDARILEARKRIHELSVGYGKGWYPASFVKPRVRRLHAVIRKYELKKRGYQKILKTGLEG